MRLVAALLALALLGCAGPGQGIGTRVTTIGRAPSGKTLAVYSSSTFSTQAREVPQDVVVQGLRASSMFFEEDIRALVPEITPALAQLAPDQRVVIESRDTAVHVFVSASTGELQIIAYRTGQELSRHASAIPAAPIKTELTSKPRPVHTSPPPAVVETHPRVEPPPVAAPPVQQPPAVAQPAQPAEPAKQADTGAKQADAGAKNPGTKPAAKPSKPATKPASEKPAKPAARLSEAEIRAKLDELDRLRAKGLITDAEYQQKRKALLDQL